MNRTLTTQLLTTLRRGVTQLSDEAVASISCFVQSQQDEAGAFLNRSGKPDIYYTLFGWSLCYVLGIKIDADKSERYLTSIDTDTLDLVHFTAYCQCSILRRLLLGNHLGALATVYKLRAKRKGMDEFASVPHNDIHAPYSQYIGLTMKEAMATRIKEKAKLLEQLQNYRVAGGGYKNDRDGIEATLNATVAALAVRGALKGFDSSNPLLTHQEIQTSATLFEADRFSSSRTDSLEGISSLSAEKEDVIFLWKMQQPSGGFPATLLSPIPDLLSTATALFMLSCYGIAPNYDATPFIEAHWMDEGGFSATLLDEVSDVEYTFYGLLALGAATTCNHSE